MEGGELGNTIITGGDGIIGSYIDFGSRLSRRDLDVTDHAAVENAFHKIKPNIVIHLAAMTDMEACEREPSRAWEVNALGTFHVASLCRRASAKMVYISTAVVFSGEKDSFRETDLPNPASVYARTKYAGELIVRDLMPHYLILRTSWVFGGGPSRDHKFVGKIARALRAHNPVKAATDHVGSPTFAKDFVERMNELIRQNREGIFHVVNAGTASRWDMAREIASCIEPSAKIETASLQDFGITADRASREVLTTSETPLRSWQEAIADYLTNEWSSRPSA